MKLKLVISLLMLFITQQASCEVLKGHNSRWMCAAFDSSNKQWLSTSSFLKVALNKASQQCKSQSGNPASCTVAKEYCEMIIKGRRNSRAWTCMAFDKMGHTWNSDTHNNRDDAAVGAKQVCKTESTFPDSCYVRLMTCKNLSRR